jgi:hypothetical protein
VTRVDMWMIWKIILSSAGVRKFHLEILHSSSWTIYRRYRCESVDTNSTQQRLISLDPWWWRSQNFSDELHVVEKKTFFSKLWPKWLFRNVSDTTTPRYNSKNSENGIPMQTWDPK